METGTKILIATGIVAGGFVIYKLTRPTRVNTISSASRTPSTSATDGFLNLVSSAATYFGRTAPSLPATSNTAGPSAYQGSSGAEAYAYEAGGVLPKDATPQDIATGEVVYGPFL